MSEISASGKQCFNASYLKQLLTLLIKIAAGTPFPEMSPIQIPILSKENGITS